MKNRKTLVVLSAAAALLGAASGVWAAVQANTPVGLWEVTAYTDNTPGMNLAAAQRICILPNGTWYGTTFPNWSGRWFQKGAAAAGNGDRVRISGNYAGGRGNDAAELDFVNANLMSGPWTEWRDPGAGNYQHWIRANVVRLQRTCPPMPAQAAPAEAARETRNPIPIRQ